MNFTHDEMIRLRQEHATQKNQASFANHTILNNLSNPNSDYKKPVKLTPEQKERRARMEDIKAGQLYDDDADPLFD